MVDAEDLLLAEDVLHDPLELERGLEVDPEGLLDDAADVGVGVVVQPGRLERADDDREVLRRRREVVGAVELAAAVLVELVDQRREPEKLT
jgi:hypothetical protein